MINELLRQKRIHGLKETISKEEEKLLIQGMPIQKIIGFINFDDVKININRNVLIPRYETEEVVEAAMKYIHEKSRVLDLCTGSGYIGLTIKKKKNANVVMSDLSDEAIKQAEENAKLNKLNVKIIKSDMFKNIDGKFDVIISNPPYIPQKIILPDSVIKYEPHNALFAGDDGNDFYKIIVKNAQKYLNKNGVIILEIAEDNREYLSSNGYEIFKDINDKNRIAIKKY